jgi:hypothetical protein
MEGVPVAQKIALGNTSPDGFLPGEVSIGRTLIRRIGRSEYPACLSRLVGYDPGMSEDVKSARPSAVFTYQPHTLSDISHQLPVDPRLFWQIADGLIVALCYLQAAQVVHRRIRLETVRWDGSDGRTVQLADFSYAVPEWELRPRPVGEAPWDPPEARGAAGSADCRDDVYAIALLLARLATGQEFADDGEASEAITRLDMGQRRLLSKAIAPRRRDRPAASELRKLRRLSDPLNPVLRGDQARESEAQARFAELRRRQETAARRLASQAAQSSQSTSASQARGRARGADGYGASIPMGVTRYPPRLLMLVGGGLLLVVVVGLAILIGAAL